MNKLSFSLRSTSNTSYHYSSYYTNACFTFLPSSIISDSPLFRPLFKNSPIIFSFAFLSLKMSTYYFILLSSQMTRKFNIPVGVLEPTNKPLRALSTPTLFTSISYQIPGLEGLTNISNLGFTLV